MRALRLMVLAALPLVAGCAGDGIGPGLTTEASVAASLPAATADPLSSGGKPPAQFNPFADATATPPGGREVIVNPSAAEVMKAGPLPEIAIGRADAPVTIIKYASLTCPYCRKFQMETFPELKRQYIDTGKVRFIIREFPIGFQSGAATVVLRCAPPGKYFDLYGKFLAQQARWVSQEVRYDPIFEVARQVGMTRADFDACRQNQAMIDGLKWVKERGRTLGVIGTPNFFVDGRLIKSQLGMKEIRDLVEPALASAAGGPGTGPNAGMATASGTPAPR
jgi:protein-disulfide isomerase